MRAIIANEATVLLCTPTYGLHLAEVAAGLGVNLADESAVRVTIQAGEPGAGLPATRKRIEAVWGARCFDHAGATEVGPWGFECDQADGLHINEAEFIYEVVDPETLEPAQEGELVITNLGRAAMPVIRYRTGDQVRLRAGEACACGSPFAKLDGGVIGRVDDALLIRGLVVYPSHIENVIRRFPQVGEFAVDVYRPQAMDELEIQLEELEGGAAGARGGAVDGALADRVASAIREEFGLRASVTQVEQGTLPRFELKARRFTDHRKAGVGEAQ